MKTKKQLIQQINAAKRRIAKERDKLRDLASELDAIADGCDEAAEELTSAADSLSRYL